MPELTVVLVFLAWILEAMKDMEAKFGVNDWTFTIFASAFALGTPAKPHTTFWKWTIEEVQHGNTVQYVKSTDKIAYDKALHAADVEPPSILAHLKANNLPIDWDDLRAETGRKYPAKEGAPWRSSVGVKNTVRGPLSAASRGHELGIACGNSFLRINFGLEAQLVVVQNKDWDWMLAKGTIPSNRDDPWKQELRRCFVLPKHLQNRYSKEGQQDIRHVVVFAAWRFCHDDGVTILLIDHVRLLNMSLLKFPSGFQKDFLDFDHPAYTTLWGETHGPDFILQPQAHAEALNKWRDGILSIPLRKSPAGKDRRNRPIVDAIYKNTEVFNGLGAHTANDLVAMIGLHPCTPVFDVCSKTELWDSLLVGLQRCRNNWTYQNMRQFVRRRTDGNPFAFDYEGDTLYINQFIYTASKVKTTIPFEDWKKLVSQGLLDKNHIIGRPYLKPVVFTKKELAAKVKWVDVLRVHSKGKNWYTPILAQAPPDWCVDKVEWASDENGKRVWKDLRACGLQTTLGPNSMRDQKRNEAVPEKLSQGGPRTKIHNGLGGRPRYDKPLKANLAKRSTSGSNRSIKPKVGAELQREPFQPLNQT